MMQQENLESSIESAAKNGVATIILVHSLGTKFNLAALSP